MAVSKKAWLGVATEATPGTPVSPPTMLAPTKASFKNRKKYVYLDEERGTRDGNNGRVSTTRYAEGTLKGNWYNDSGVYFLLALMGTDTPSQPNAGSDPLVWQHALALADVPPTLTLYRALDSAAVYQIPYVCVTKLVFKWSAAGKTLEMDGDFQGRYTGPKQGSPPSRPSDTSILPFAGYSPTIQIAGSSSSDIEEATLTLEQKVELWFNSAGNPDFATAYFGERTAKVDFTARFDADSFYANFTGDTDTHVNVAFTGANIQGSYAESLTFDFPIVGWDEMDHDTSKVNILVKAKGTARPGTSVNSLFTATVQNAVSSYSV